MPSAKDFEEQLSHLTNDQYNALVQERIARLTPEQQVIARAREEQRHDRLKLAEKAFGPDGTEEDHERLQNAMRQGTDACEHGRSYCKYCAICAEMDHTMFPELFNEFGEHYQDDE